MRTKTSYNLVLIFALSLVAGAVGGQMTMLSGCVYEGQTWIEARPRPA